MAVLEFGHRLLFVGMLVTALVLVLSVASLILKERRLVRAARCGFYTLFVIIAFSGACLAHGFITGQYNNDYIFNYSEKFLPVFFKAAGLWAGLDGSLLFWTMILSGFSALVAFQHRWSSQHPTGRRLEPYVYLVLSVIVLFFVYLSWSENPFEVMPLEKRLRLASHYKIDLDQAGNLTDGVGLNMQLVNYWFVIHPPSLYIGFIGFTVPFAFAMAALIAGEVGDYWIRVVRRWTMVSWLFLTSGIILGGLWAYRQLGWGGYWAWDPVENASFLPWCTATAFLHSVMVHERRDMLKGWNAFLIILTFFLTIWGTWMTRSGVVESVHAFAGGDIGIKFQFFMLFIGGIGLFFLFFRSREMRSTNRIDSLLSREAAFYLNNLVLVVIALAIAILSFWSKITHDFAAEKSTLREFHYNLVMTPFFALLLFLTAVGPGLGWVKTSPTALRRNFVKPALATVGFLIVLYGWWQATDRLGTWHEVLVPRLEEQHATALYPTGLFLALAFFICAALFSEFYRSVAARVRFRKEDMASAVFNVVVRNNRRWGGYIVHIGIAILTVGIVVSSMFKVEKQITLRLHESEIVGPYRITALSRNVQKDPRPGEPYRKDEVVFRVTRVPESALPTAHGQTQGGDETSKTAGAATAAIDGEEFVTDLHAEIRVYPKKEESIKEVSIERQLWGDIYLYYGAESGDELFLTVFLNPLMILIYLGWFTMLGGGIFAALPIPGSKVGLAD